MPDIIQHLKDAYISNPAEALSLLPEVIQAVEEGKIAESSGTVYEVERVYCRICQKDHCRIIEKQVGKDIYFTREAAEKALLMEKGK